MVGDIGLNESSGRHRFEKSAQTLLIVCRQLEIDETRKIRAECVEGKHDSYASPLAGSTLR